MKTRQDLIIAVLEKLNAVGVGQAPAAEDILTVGAKVDGKLPELAHRQVIYVPDADQIEDEYLDPLATIVADASAASYGQARNRDAVIWAENTLREMQIGVGAGSQVIRAQYF